ncbi:kinase-like domain-containing protein [Rhizophagus irregularis DAOM 181602=DAOM 197198]|uniref:Kinase-like domain-containing protein n=2 Tax=Rhizophagus irregularis TaxID=588596 RepID=A0A2H5U4G8_RHIID|nr:kinase-like domain-containing protein [Rhizophagus irregularis DAOM 181602=DAOM 197198]POG71801.1 kinase-like domain-containing protein [Rhizophagus irregularis DAOM 181602=DAOM 197198]|eukprot:XP_025178667.1 kinase-like domain-containing protein [Rhizophagus irregularis DAOM 181602=DAOM 197198]
MSNIRMNLIEAALTRAHLLIDYNICVGFHKQYEFCEQKILDDDSLTEEEKTEAIRLNNKGYDRDKITYNLGTRRICENCNQKCLATLYCEYCIRNYLKANFSNWTSGNNDIDDLIKKCQMETNNPAIVIEWIPYNNLENIKYLTKGGFSEIYTAKWIGGQYEEWDSKVQQLVRVGTCNVILKELKNVENASQSWFEEAKSHLTLSNKRSEIVQCYGITQNPSHGNYILVMNKCDINLREYLQQNHNQLTWNERIRIAFEIIDAFDSIHKENSIHRDLHSGNILYSQFYDLWRISDLGFCGPADKPSTSIYGILPYIAPEVIIGRGYTFKSDIYSIAMLMWEISSGQPPFMNYEHDCNLAINIINGMRPKIISEIPLKYKSLMEQCWDANPLKRPDANTLLEKIREIKTYYQNNPNELPQLIAKVDKEKINMNSKLFTSKIYNFENLSEPKNATEEQKAFYITRSYDFGISSNTSNLSKSSNQYISISSNDNDSKESPRLSKKLKIENVDVQNDYEREFMQRRSNIGTNDEVQNNPSLHSEQNTKSEILDDES